jgi:hypothetical protein
LVRDLDWVPMSVICGFLRSSAGCPFNGNGYALVA